MAKSGEMAWLDAIEASKNGDYDSALESAKDVVHIDPSHSDAWMAIASWSLPPRTRGKPTHPSLQQSARAVAAVRKVVTIDPDNTEAWILGGWLLVDQLGMLDEALAWWESYREHRPTDVTPLIEQISILVNLGLYEECADRLNELSAEKMDAPSNEQAMRMDGIRRMVERAAKMEADEIFKPQNHKHPRWGVIEKMKKVKPISSTFWLIMFIAPIVFIFGTLAMTFLGDSIFGTILVFMLILAMFTFLTRASMGMLQKRNRHALDIDRAIDMEMTSGKLCIPDSIRYSIVYNSMLSKRSPSLQSRLEHIIEADEKINHLWEINLPNWSSIEEDENYTDIDEDLPPLD